MRNMRYLWDQCCSFLKYKFLCALITKAEKENVAEKTNGPKLGRKLIVNLERK